MPRIFSILRRRRSGGESATFAAQRFATLLRSDAADASCGSTDHRPHHRHDVRSLAEVKRSEQPVGAGCDPRILLARVETVVRRIETQLAPLRPEGPLTLGQIQPEHYRYFAAQEQAARLRELCRQLAERLDAAQLKARAGPTYSDASPDRRHLPTQR